MNRPVLYINLLYTNEFSNHLNAYLIDDSCLDYEA